MKQYRLDARTGTMEIEPPEKTEEPLSEDSYRILLATPEEFEKNGMRHPYKNNLVHSMNYDKYCKVEYFRNCIQGTIRLPLVEGNKQKPFLFGFLLYRNTLWMVSGDAELEERVERTREDGYEGFDIQDFLLAFFNHLIEGDMAYLQRIEEGLDRMEENVTGHRKEHFNEVIMKNRRKLSQRHGYYMQLMNIGDYMQSILREQKPDVTGGWDLFTRRAERLQNYVEMMQEHLLQIREMYQTEMDIEQNRIVTFLTVITTIFLPLTLVTGWYGMNFAHMPELGWKYGYLLIILLSAAVLAVEVWYCRKKKML